MDAVSGDIFNISFYFPASTCILIFLFFYLGASGVSDCCLIKIYPYSPLNYLNMSLLLEWSQGAISFKYMIKLFIYLPKYLIFRGAGDHLVALSLICIVYKYISCFMNVIWLLSLTRKPHCFNWTWLAVVSFEIISHFLDFICITTNNNCWHFRRCWSWIKQVLIVAYIIMIIV